MTKYYHFSGHFLTEDNKALLSSIRSHVFSEIVIAEDPIEAEGKLEAILQLLIPKLSIVPHSIISERVSLIEEIVNIEAPVRISFMKDDE